MSLYLHDKGQQTGPFTEDQIRQMLQSGQVSRDALAWREGMANWTPVQQVVGAAPAGIAVGATAAPATQSGGKPVLGWISLGFLLVSIPVWIILFIVAAVSQKGGTSSQGPLACAGIFMILGGILNFIAMVVGFVGIFTSRAKLVPILGAVFNALVVLFFIAILIVGLIAKNQQ